MIWRVLRRGQRMSASTWAPSRARTMAVALPVANAGPGWIPHGHYCDLAIDPPVPLDHHPTLSSAHNRLKQI